jgi:hypothetical protein
VVEFRMMLAAMRSTGHEREPAALYEWLDEWVLDLQADRPGGETITVYTRSIRQFLSWLASVHPEVTDESALTKAHVQR